MKKIANNKGFTLIEILVVIGIIAVLATIVLIAINPARQFAQANNSQRSSNVNAILNAIGQYTADNKGALPTLPAGEVNEALCDDLVPTYIPAIPTDPKSASKGSSIAICSEVDAGDVGYTVSTNAGRVTLTASSTELTPTPPCSGTGTNACISVTR